MLRKLILGIYMQKKNANQKSNIASKEKLEQLRQNGLKKLKNPAIREVFIRLRDK